MIRAVVFDLYGTLVRGGGPRRDAVMGELSHRLGMPPEAFDATSQERMRGDMGSLEETFAALGDSPSPGDVRLAVLTWQRFHRTILWPTDSTLSTLDELRARGLKLGLVSNCSQETPIQWPAQPMAARIDAAVFSCDVRLLKPDPAIYLAVCAALSVEPAECIYVGDGADQELRGAAAVGMRAIRTLEYTYSDPAWTGETIGKLSEVIGRLG